MLDITTLAAWGELIGGVAVVISLVYLAAQIRANTKIVRAANYGDIAAGGGFNRSILDSDVATLWVRGLEDYASLAAEDRWRFNSLASLVFDPFHRAWDLHRRGLIDDEMLNAQAHGWVALYESPGFKQWWEDNQHCLKPGLS